MKLGLNGKTALITGGSKGKGILVAEVFAEEGCHVQLAARTRADLTAASEHQRRPLCARRNPCHRSERDQRFGGLGRRLSGH